MTAGLTRKGWQLKKAKKLQQPLEKYVFPVILLLWPLVAANQGICVSDTTYSIVNYRYLTGGSGSTWLFATFLANEAGHFLTLLPGGGTLLGMNLYTGLTVSATALCVYGCMSRIIPKWMLFLGEFLAISLCWCPTVILYNYLTYFLLTAACLFLFLALTGVPVKRRYFVLAGVCLGLNVTVRFSNLAEAALILPVWFGSRITDGRQAPRQKVLHCLQRTLLCLLGYAAGFAAGLLPALHYGLSSYFAMIPALLGMTSSASDYTLGRMVADTAAAWKSALRWSAVLLPCIFMGCLLFLMPVTKSRAGRIAARILYLAGLAAVVRFFYSRGMFTVNYRDYWSMFGWGMQFAVLSALAAVLGVAGAGGTTAEERILSALVLALTFITPIGSNNYTFPLLNCLFFTAPYTLWMFRRCLVQTGNREYSFSWTAAAAMLIVMTMVQGALFHINFAFRDGTDGTARTATVGNCAFLSGMRTTQQNAEDLEGLCGFLSGRGQEGQKVIAFGNAPGISVIADIPPRAQHELAGSGQLSVRRYGGGTVCA